MEMRQMVRADCERVAAIAATAPILRTYPLYFYEMLCDAFPSSCWVAVDGEDIVGYTVGYVTERGEEFIYQMCVSQDHRGRGIASHLVEHVVDVTTTPRLTATVKNENRASFATFERVAAQRTQLVRSVTLSRGSSWTSDWCMRPLRSAADRSGLMMFTW